MHHVDILARLPAETTGVITRCIQREHPGQVMACLQDLDPLDREIVILRGIEQNQKETVATLLGLPPITVSHRYRRALDKPKTHMEDSVLAELDGWPSECQAGDSPCPGHRVSTRPRRQIAIGDQAFELTPSRIV